MYEKNPLGIIQLVNDENIGGEALQKKRELQSNIDLKMEDLERAKYDLKWTRDLEEKKYVASSDLKADELKVKRLDVDVERAQTNLDLFERYEFAKQEKRCWKCGDAMLSLERALVMGILNVTPDSFSDGGLYFDSAVAVAHAHQMIDLGADIIDVGGESTRPGAQAVSVEDELKRVIPVIKALKSAVKVPVSIDTRHAAVAQAAFYEGASIVNNIMPLDGDFTMARLVAEYGVGLVVMHMRGTPDTMSDQAVYDDVISDVFDGLKVSFEFSLKNGVAAEQMVVDPGIGFAKKLKHNLELLAGLEKFMELAPVMVGVSRKRFVGEICGVQSAADRVGGSLGAAVWSILHGASIIRVHDVKESFQAVSVLNALRKAGEKRA